ncbi:alpha/beta hydrolase [Amycolatopsis acidicola]|uniref:Alpha/beta hydrolase n=1 Tax=Amycolatopsis acidicola TaxID=2596893 RepID=A0A5N0V3A5_9PSEU|nr:alpha/beta hydrolase [Amycolatopsis acidicola]KAA9159348.1 alpha/beta hydrolase [Amycolatopsis acidicola]
MELTLEERTVDLTIDVQGGEVQGSEGKTFLLLHGGGGSKTVAMFANLLARQPAKVVTPVHPGFDGTARPSWLNDVPTLARLYARLLETLDLQDVAVIGNSIGGWIAAELAALGSARISSLTLANAVGIEVPGHPIADTFGLTPAELAQLSFHDASKFPTPPENTANKEVLELYAGPHEMADPSLEARLAKITCPTLVAWGESDQVVDADYGRAYAKAIPGAEFRLLPGSGHLPQIETPTEFRDVLWEFAVGHR